MASAENIISTIEEASDARIPTRVPRNEKVLKIRTIIARTHRLLNLYPFAILIPY